MSTRLVIERKGGAGIGWQIVSYPENNIEEAKKVLINLQCYAKKKKYKSKFRLVRETREIIEV